MPAQYFEWDANKAASNYHKHRIRFELALEVFDDPFALSEQDRIENGEARWRVVGWHDGQQALAVDGRLHDEARWRAKRNCPHYQRPPGQPPREENL